MLGAAEVLLGGTTAVLDMETVRHTPSAFKALERIGIRAVAGKCLMDAHPEGAPLELAESTDGALAEAESLARRWHGAAGDRLRVCFAPRFVPSCSGPLLRAMTLREIARRASWRAAPHARRGNDRRAGDGAPHHGARGDRLPRFRGDRGAPGGRGALRLGGPARERAARGARDELSALSLIESQAGARPGG